MIANNPQEIDSSASEASPSLCCISEGLTACLSLLLFSY